jgi:hypothetical protein
MYLKQPGMKSNESIFTLFLFATLSPSPAFTNSSSVVDASGFVFSNASYQNIGWASYHPTSTLDKGDCRGNNSCDMKSENDSRILVPHLCRITAPRCGH